MDSRLRGNDGLGCLSPSEHLNIQDAEDTEKRIKRIPRRPERDPGSSPGRCAIQDRLGSGPTTIPASKQAAISQINADDFIIR